MTRILTQPVTSKGRRVDYPQVSTAVFNLRPGCTWTLEGEELYENIKWDESNEQDIPTKEEVEAEIERIKVDSAMQWLKIERDKRLIATDWWAVSDRTMTPEQIAYRQALRDITHHAQPIIDPSDPTMITNVDWPVEPEA